MTKNLEQMWNQLAMPTGALHGLLRPLLALEQGQRAFPSLDRVEAWLFCADNGISARSQVNHYPRAVTRLMTQTFLHEKSAASVLARENGVRLNVANVGLEGSWNLDHCGFTGDYLSSEILDCGTNDMVTGPAMTSTQFQEAWRVGEQAVQLSADRGADLLIFGEMGIGNTSTASALASYLLQQPDLDPLVGLGAGLPEHQRELKRQTIAKAIKRAGISYDQFDVRNLLQELGGFDIVAIASAQLSAARLGIPVLLDGFIVSVATLAGKKLGALPAIIPASLSKEPAHQLVLDHLDLPCPPLLDLELCLGEGSAALLALPLLRNALAIANHTATLEQVLAMQPSS